MSLPWTKRRKTARPGPVPALASVPAAAPVAEFARPRGRHARPGEPDLGELTLTDKPRGILHPDGLPAAEDPERAGVSRETEETSAYIPAFAEAAPRDRQRPYAPENEPPAVYLLAVGHDGSDTTEALTGLPAAGGVRVLPDGRRVAGAWLGTGEGAWYAFETDSASVLDAAIEALRTVREELVYGDFRPPAVQPDPAAAEHRDALERELNACLDWARDVLKAAGDFGFLSAALRQQDGAGVLNAIVARAGLYRAIESGDEVAAADAASGLVGIVRDLCGDAVADSLARGEVPAAEAEPEVDVQPEPEPAAEGEPVAAPADVTEVGEDASQDGPVAA